MRAVAQLVEVLAVVLRLKARGETSEALREIDQALAGLLGLSSIESVSLDQLLAVCPPDPGLSADPWILLADILRERGELLLLHGNVGASQFSYAMGLGLCLEKLHTGPITVELIGKTDELIALTGGARLPASVLQRLFAYREAKGQLAKAEDVLFEWFEAGARIAHAAGLAFYDRLANSSDEELRQGGLSRAEVEQGREEWIKRLPRAS